MVHTPIVSHFCNAEKANEITRQYFSREPLPCSPIPGSEQAVVWFTGWHEDGVSGRVWSAQFGRQQGESAGDAT